MLITSMESWRGGYEDRLRLGEMGALNEEDAAEAGKGS